MFSYAYRIRCLQKLHSEAFMGLNAVCLPDSLPAGAVYRSSLPATPVSTPIRESWIFSEQQLRERLCKTPSPRKCRFFDPRRSESGLNSFDNEWLDSARRKMETAMEDDKSDETSPEDADSVKENEAFYQKKLFVGNISYRVTKRQLRDFLSKFGKVVDCTIVQDHIKRWPKGYGFVTFSKVEEAEKARNAPPDQLELDGRQLRLLPANKTRVSKIRKEAQVAAERRALARELDGDEESDMEADVTPATPPPSPRRAVDHVDDLPDDALLMVLAWLDIKSRIRIERVCQRWRRLALRLWRSQDKLSFSGVFSICEGKPLTVSILRALLVRCGESLHSLDLPSASHALDYKAAEAISMLCPNLEYLDASGVQLTNVSVQQLAQKCPKLKTVLLKRCSDVGEKGLWWLLHLCKYLEHLDLTELHKLSGQCFHMAGVRLRRLVLRGCSGLTATGLSKIATKCCFLSELTLSDCLQISDHDLLLLCQNLRALRLLHLSGSFLNLTADSIGAIGHLPLLEELNLSHNKAVNDVVIGAICAGCTKLRFLDITGCHHGITDVALSHLSRCPGLRQLKLNYLGQITDSGLGSLSCQGSLQSIELRGCPQVSDGGVLILVELCRDLRLLDVSGCELVTNAAVTGAMNTVGERSNVLTIVIGGTLVEPNHLYLDPTSKLKIDRHNFCVELYRPDRLERMAYDDDHDWNADLDGYEGDGEAEARAHDYLENDDPLYEEDYILS
ncbi:putative RNA-binding protein EEED8.10 isoform X2 [Dermacentor albipictus]|uniref:putative RNA-binding protein EEED8.10 isoform X2 n=1 Tax=Dermacentor albipictus TaxID=60249 RepID=UPI0031FBAC34